MTGPHVRRPGIECANQYLSCVASRHSCGERGLLVDQRLMALDKLPIPWPLLRPPERLSISAIPAIASGRRVAALILTNEASLGPTCLRQFPPPDRLARVRRPGRSVPGVRKYGLNMWRLLGLLGTSGHPGVAKAPARAFADGQIPI